MPFDIFEGKKVPSDITLSLDLEMEISDAAKPKEVEKPLIPEMIIPIVSGVVK
jgi:hypothetical protein